MPNRKCLAIGLVLAGSLVAAFYLYESFVYPDATIRVALRTAPVLPAAVWTLWWDASRPFKDATRPLQLAGRVVALLAVMAVAFLVLGLGLNWIYDPKRVL